MNKQHLLSVALAMLASLVLLGFGVEARADPPSRVARLGYAAGAVSFSPGGEADWVQAAVNRPLTTGEYRSQNVPITFLRIADDRKGRYWRASHRVHVVKCVDRSDMPIRRRIVRHRSKEVNGLNKRDIVGKALASITPPWSRMTSDGPRRPAPAVR